jgi:hypothetical protein
MQFTFFGEFCATLNKLARRPFRPRYPPPRADAEHRNRAHGQQTHWSDTPK